MRQEDRPIKYRRSERGQALAEYVPLIPPMLLLAMSVLIPISDHLNEIFCLMAGTFVPQACQVAETPEPEEPEAPPEPVCTTLQQELGASQCDQSADCNVLPGVNAATYTAADDIESFVIKAGQEYHVYGPGVTDDGCYIVDVSGPIVSWQKVGSGSSCKDVSHAQAWKVPLCAAE